MSLTPRIGKLDKNHLINGAMDFWQRSTASVNLTTGSVYQSVDRFTNYYTGAITGSATIIRDTDIPLNSFGRYSAKISSRRNASTMTHTHYQKIESVFARALSGQTVSIRLDVKAEVATTCRLVLVNYATADVGGAGTQIYTQSVTIGVGAWQEVKFENITLGAVNNGLGVQIHFDAASGTDAAVKATWMTNIKLSIGTSAQEMSLASRNYAEELSLCQRYFEKSYPLDIPVGTITPLGKNEYMSTGWSTTNEYRTTILFITRKRIAATCFPYNPVNGVINTMSDSRFSNNRAATTIGSESSFSLSSEAGVGTFSGHYVHWTADAEI